VLGKLLKLWRLSLKRKIKTKNINVIQKILDALIGRTNILAKVKPKQPFMGVTSDMTELTCRAGKFYLCIHKDIVGQRAGIP